MLSILPPKVLTLAEVLQNKGYDTYFLNGGNAMIHPVFGFKQGFSEYIYPSPFSMGKTPLITRSDELIGEFLSIIKNKQHEKFFAYIHFMDTHIPYNTNKFNNFFYYDSKGRFKPGPGPNEILSNKIREMTANKTLTEDDKNQIIGIYDGQIRFVDNSIGLLIEGLKELDLFKDTIFIITADHGEEFWDHDSFEHGHTLYNELLHIPFIMAGPMIGQGEISKRIRIIDLMPTILDLFKIKANNELGDGISFADLLKDSVQKPDNTLPVLAFGTFFGDEKYGLIDGESKIIYNTTNTQGKESLLGYRNTNKYELYNLYIDPNEKNNLELKDKDKLQNLKHALDKYKAHTIKLKSKNTELGEDMKKRIRSLGYLQ